MLNNSPTRIFIIDDDKMLSLVLKKEIEKAFEGGYITVSTFGSGEHADIYLSQKPDIAIVDFNLNSENKHAMNGLEIIEMIKERSPATEVIMCSSEEREEVPVQAMKAGARDYVLKNEQMFRKVSSAILQCLKVKKAEKEIEGSAFEQAHESR